MKDITLIIPTRNNLKYAKFAYSSIRENIGSDVNVVILDDASSDGTWEWLSSVVKEDKNLQIERNDGPERVGHTVLYDLGVSICKTEIFGIFHADMVASKNYVTNMVKHLKRKTVVSGTRIEPPLHPGGPEKIVKNFGLEPEEFKKSDFDKFVEHQENINQDDTTSGIFAPWIMYKEDFESIGGHDKRLFAPMELEDSDLFNRFMLNGLKLIQSRDAFVYHMTCRGSRFKDGVKIEKEIPLTDGSTWYKPKDSEEYTKLRQIKFREWWRKWHTDVLHDELMLPIVTGRYDVSFVLENANMNYLGFLEPWCDKVYVKNYKNESFIKDYINSESRTTQFDLHNKIKTSDPTNDDVIVSFDCSKLTNDNFNNVIKNLQFIISQNVDEVGEFEVEIFNIKVNKIKDFSKNLINCNDDWFISKLNK